MGVLGTHTPHSPQTTELKEIPRYFLDPKKRWALSVLENLIGKGYTVGELVNRVKKVGGREWLCRLVLNAGYSYRTAIWFTNTLYKYAHGTRPDFYHKLMHPKWSPYVYLILMALSRKPNDSYRSFRTLRKLVLKLVDRYGLKKPIRLINFVKPLVDHGLVLKRVGSPLRRVQSNSVYLKLNTTKEVVEKYKQEFLLRLENDVMWHRYKKEYEW